MKVEAAVAGLQNIEHSAGGLSHRSHSQMKRDLWITVIGVLVAGLALSWTLSKERVQASHTESNEEEPKVLPSG